MQIILISSPCDKSFFPLTNGVRAKQFLKLFTGENNKKESQAQRVLARVRAEYPGAEITFAAPVSQVESIRSQFGEDVNIALVPENCDEETARNSACEFLADKGTDKNEEVKILSPSAGINSWSELANELKSHDTLVINELNIPVITAGTKNLIIAASPDGILVADRRDSAQTEKLADELNLPRPMYEERRWGEYTVLSQTAHSLVKNLFIKAGKSISLQAHNYRSEVWVIASGEGIFTLDDETREVRAGDVLKIAVGQKHKISAVF